MREEKSAIFYAGGQEGFYMVTLHLIGKTDEVAQGLCELEDILQFSLSEKGISVLVEKAENGLSVHCEAVDGQPKYHITYSRIPEFFRAFAIVINAVKTNSSDIGPIRRT